MRSASRYMIRAVWKWGRPSHPPLLGVPGFLFSPAHDLQLHRIARLRVGDAAHRRRLQEEGRLRHRLSRRWGNRPEAPETNKQQTQWGGGDSFQGCGEDRLLAAEDVDHGHQSGILVFRIPNLNARFCSKL